MDPTPTLSAASTLCLKKTVPVLFRE